MMQFWDNYKKKRNRQRLKDESYAYLFDPPPDEEYICFDCETTGLNPKKAEILSIGAVKIKGNRILTSEKLELFIRPSESIDPASIKVHLIRHCDVENGLSPEDALLEFLKFIGSRRLVGYYLEFDVAMVNKYLHKLLGITLPHEQIDVSGIFYDKKQDALNPSHVDLRFDVIMEELGLPTLGKHDAFNDALMTAMIFLKLQRTPKL